MLQPEHLILLAYRHCKNLSLQKVPSLTMNDRALLGILVLQPEYLIPLGNRYYKNLSVPKVWGLVKAGQY